MPPFNTNAPAVASPFGGQPLPQTPEEWKGWVSASSTRGYMLGDTLGDWLNYHGEQHGFKLDTDYPDFDERTVFLRFLFAQGHAFEEAVVRLLDGKFGLTAICNASEDISDEIQKLSNVVATREAMRRGEPIIYQGVLWDPASRTYGAPDLLVRSDVVNQIVPGTLLDGDVRTPAPGIGARDHHYIVLDTKFTTLHLLASGDLGNSGSSPAHKAQLFVYNRALATIQGYLPPAAFLLGRGWEDSGKDKTRALSCFARLAPVRQTGVVTNKRPLADEVEKAVAWVRRMKTEGAAWDVLPKPSVPELWPEKDPMGFPWHHAKVEIARKLEDLSLLWNVRAEGREAAHDRGLVRWTDPACTAAALGVSGKNGVTLNTMLDINRSTTGPLVTPARVKAAEDVWRPTPPLEFYVDFETVSDINDDFSRLPEKGGQPLIFMIGCGHVENGEWRFECFITNDLTEPAEARIIDAWLAHMTAVQRRLGVAGTPRILHWSPAEDSRLDQDYNSATKRHPEKSWPAPNWFDLLANVARAEPFVVKGAWGFGLKAVAKNMYSHGLIQTKWDDSITDGLGAMVGAWWCAGEAQKRGVALKEIDLTREIARYNEVDCKVMMEIVRYWRGHH